MRINFHQGSDINTKGDVQWHRRERAFACLQISVYYDPLYADKFSKANKM